jgi:hypothetical protein
VPEISIDLQAIAIIALSIHTQFIHIARGFKGDELSLSALTPNSSALERSSRSICLCNWAIGSSRPPNAKFMTG